MEENLCQYNMEKSFLSLIAMFANSKDAAWNQNHVAAVTKPKIITELFACENKGIKIELIVYQLLLLLCLCNYMI